MGIGSNVSNLKQDKFNLTLNLTFTGFCNLGKKSDKPQLFYWISPGKKISTRTITIIAITIKVQ